MKIPGLKYFKFLNIGRLFLDGEEVTATADQLNDVSKALDDGAVTFSVRVGTVKLNGANPTPVDISAGSPAEHEGTTEETFDFSTSKEIEVTPDGLSAEALELGGAAGYHEGTDQGAIDISSDIANKFQIAVDGDELHEVELTVAGLNSGAAIASAMQTEIRKIAGYDAVTVDFTSNDGNGTGTYKITSGTKGTASSVEIGAGTENDVADALKIGAAGASIPGEGCGADVSKCTAAEVAAFINEEAENFIAEDRDGYVAILGKVVGGRLVVADKTGNAVLGFSDATYYGVQGLGYGEPMADADYYVALTPAGIDKAGKANIKLVAVDNKTKDGFDIVCSEDGSTFDVDIVVVDKPR